MCGRFLLTSLPDEFSALYDLPVGREGLPWSPRYNIAPSQPVLIVRLDATGARELALARWGLIPSSARDTGSAYHTINARAETVATKPTFREAFRQRRCLVPADGFYEWQASLHGRSKTPYCVRRADGRPFAFAGLWDRWRAPDGKVIESCSIITTAANEVVHPIHDRMPVILTDEQFARWLDPATRPQALAGLLVPAVTALEVYPVSTLVNRPENDQPECIVPIVIG